MGEIDTKPIESVQTAINFFGHTNNEHRKNSPTNDKEGERETDIERLERELANIKVQLEVKEATYKQALVKLDHYQKTTDELSTLLKNSDLKKNFYINESQKAGSRVIELESSLEKVQEHLQSTQDEVARLKEATSQMQALETLLSEANLRNEDLSRQVSNTNEAITRLKNETERALAAKEVEISKLRGEIEVQKKRLDQASYSINALEAEIEQSRSERGEEMRLKEHVETELEKAREKEKEAEVEIALLKFEVHKGRSRLAAAEAAETRAHGEKTALYNALQQMGLEAEETKNENRMLKDEVSILKLVDHDDKKEDEEDISEELEKTKRELEVAMCKMGEQRRRAEQAISRAEAAEKAREALEEEKTKRKKQRERRKAALEALRQESITRSDQFEIKDENDDDDRVDVANAKSYQPLAKVLNMKF